MPYILWLLVVLGALSVVCAHSLAEMVGWPWAVAIVVVLAVLGLALYARAWARVRSRERLVIRRPVETVFQVVAVNGFARRGQPVTPDDEPIGAGRTRREVVQGRRPTEWTYVITEFDPNRRMAVQGTTTPPAAELRIVYDFAPVTAGTQLTVTCEYKLHGRRRFLTPFAASMVYDKTKASVTRLKHVLESHPEQGSEASA